MEIITKNKLVKIWSNIKTFLSNNITNFFPEDVSDTNKLISESRLQSALDDKQIFEFITPSVSGQSFINCTYIGGNENLEQGPWYRKGEKCGEFAVDPNKDDVTPVKEYIPVVGGPRVLKNDWAIVQYDESKCFAVIHDYKYERQKDGGDSDYGFVKLANGENAYIQIFTEGPMAGALYFVDDSRVLIQDHDITFVVTSVSNPSNAVLEFYDNDFTQPVAIYDLGLPTCRYICTQEQTDENPPKFTLQYVVENVPFTDNYLAALNSGVTSELVDKLKKVESGAQVNVQSDWAQTDSNSDDFIKNKPSITQDNSTINIIAPNTGYSAGMVNIFTEAGRGYAGEINLKTAENGGNGTININAQESGVVNMTAGTTNIKSQYVNIGTDDDGLSIQRVGDNAIVIETSPDQRKEIGSELYITAKKTGQTRGKLYLTAEGDGEIKLQGKVVSSEYGINNNKASVRTFIMTGCYNIISSSEFSETTGIFQLQKPNDYVSTDDDRYVFEYNGEFTTPATGSSLSFNVDGCTMLGEYENLDTNTKYQFSILNNVCIVIKVG